MGELVTCPTCGATISENSRYCVECGEPDAGYYSKESKAERKKQQEEYLREEEEKERERKKQLERKTHLYWENEREAIRRQERIDIQTAKIKGAISIIIIVFILIVCLALHFLT